MPRTPTALTAIALSLCMVLPGCSNGTHQSVDWYMAHKAERDTKLTWCRDDMARAADIDCLNATKAEERAMLTGPTTASRFRYDPSKLPR